MAVNHFRNILVLVGGVGGAKLAHGLLQVVPPESLTVVVNTGDDFTHYGLHISPDLDTVMYTLGGVVNREQGWGVADDTAQMLDMLRAYGEQPWFRLGDRDLATHLLRTQALNAGERLTTITARLAKSLPVSCTILPMTDAPVRTIVDTVEHGTLEFQEYFVRHRWQPTVRGLRYSGAEAAQPTPEVVAAIRQADCILIAPSNPWLSLAPMLHLPGMRDQIAGRSVPRIAVSPIVAGAAIKGPAAKLMRELGYDVSPRAVAEYYGDLLNGFVYDQQDAQLQPLSLSGVHTIALQTVMHTENDRATLAGQILDWASTGWSAGAGT